jgi:hypothetical protein
LRTVAATAADATFARTFGAVGVIAAGVAIGAAIAIRPAAVDVALHLISNRVVTRRGLAGTAFAHPGRAVGIVPAVGIGATWRTRPTAVDVGLIFVDLTVCTVVDDALPLATYEAIAAVVTDDVDHRPAAIVDRRCAADPVRGPVTEFVLGERHARVLDVFGVGRTVDDIRFDIRLDGVLRRIFRTGVGIGVPLGRHPVAIAADPPVARLPLLCVLAGDLL